MKYERTWLALAGIALLVWIAYVVNCWCPLYSEAKQLSDGVNVGTLYRYNLWTGKIKLFPPKH